MNLRHRSWPAASVHFSPTASTPSHWPQTAIWSQLFTFKTLLSPPNSHSHNALIMCQPANHHHLPLGHGVMQRYKPLLGVLLLGWIQWSTSPFVKFQVRDACHCMKHIMTALLSWSVTHYKKLIGNNTGSCSTDCTYVLVSASISVSFWQDNRWDSVEGWRRGKGENINDELTLWWGRLSCTADRDRQLLISHRRCKTDDVTNREGRNFLVSIVRCILLFGASCFSAILSKTLLTRCRANVA